MRRSIEIVRSVCSFVLALVIVGVLGLLVHEVGHGLTAEALDGEFTGLYVWPGVQVWPFSEIGDRYEEERAGDWGFNAGMATWVNGCWGDESWQAGLVALMGSGSNLILAVLALIGLWMYQPRGWARYVLAAGVWLAGDIVLYTVLPEEWPHFVFFGARGAEPLRGADQIGIPGGLFIVLVALVTVVMGTGWVGYVVRVMKREKTSE